MPSMGVSRQLLVALNNGTFPRVFTGEHKKKINLEWKKNPKQGKLPFDTVGSKKPTKAQIAMAKLFHLISQIVYPYWSYNIKHKICGCLIIEGTDCKPLSSVINYNTGKLLKKPNIINIAFLDNNKLQIFLENLHQNISNKIAVITSTLNTVNRINSDNQMPIIFVMGGQTFTMNGVKDKRLNGSFNAECNKFRKSLQKTGLNECDYLSIDIGKRQIFANSLNIIISDPEWFENMKKPNTNYPSNEIVLALNGNNLPTKCTFDSKILSELKWEKPDKRYIDHILSALGNNRPQRHYRMTRLFAEISQILYPYWSYNTKYNGTGLIVVRGQRGFNLLDNFVNTKGDLIKNARKLEATFLDIKRLQTFLNIFNLDTNKAGKPEMCTAIHSYKYKSRVIGVLFQFEYITSFCSASLPSPNNGEYEYECNLFQNMMNKYNMKSCEYLEIDIKERKVMGFTMNSMNNGCYFKINKPDQFGNKMNNIKSCGYCNAIKSKMKRCSRCNNMWYCHAKCQQPHWAIHKKKCIPASK